MARNAWIDRAANAGATRAVREGMLTVVPAFLLTALMVVCASALDELLGPTSVAAVLRYPFLQFGSLLPSFVAAGIGFMMAVRCAVPRVPSALICAVILSFALNIIDGHGLDPSSVAPFVAIAHPLLSVPLMSRVYHAQRWHIVRTTTASDATIREALNLVPPALVAAAAVGSISGLAVVMGLPELLITAGAAMPADGSLRSGVTTTLSNSLLWAGGVHGYLALRPTFDNLDIAVTMNAQDVAAGGAADHIANGSFLGSFAFIGGSGATLSLALAILLFCQSPYLRTIAIAAIPLAVFNVNEVLLYGIPILFNPRLWPPFVVVPLANVCVAYGATKLGILAPAVEPLPLNAPILANAYHVTDGSLTGPLVQLALIAGGVAIYAPFIRSFERGANGGDAVLALKSLDSKLARIVDDASQAGHEQLVPARDLHTRLGRRTDEIRKLAQLSLDLHYQPQLARTDQRMTGSEALLRLDDGQGGFRAPGEFLSWSELVGLEHHIDTWVAERAVEQVLQWQREGTPLTTTINLSASTIGHAGRLRAIARTLAPAEGRVSIELTEHALAEHSADALSVLHSMREQGIRLYLDDFGQGYSSFSYLHRFPVDAVKVDRSFVLALDAPRGKDVLVGLVALIERLELDTIVEGVETDEQLAKIPEWPSISIQGWLYAPALPATELLAFAHRQGALVDDHPVVNDRSG